jgi:hypothetical protein
MTVLSPLSADPAARSATLRGCHHGAVARSPVPAPRTRRADAGPGDHFDVGDAGRQRDPGCAAAPWRARAADGVRRGGTARPPAAARGAGRRRGQHGLRTGGRPRRAPGGGRLVLDPARPAHRRRDGGSRSGQQGPAVRPDRGDRRRHRGDPAELGQLQRAGQPGRADGPLRARLGRRPGRRETGSHRDGGASVRPPGPRGHRDAARQSDRDPGPGRRRPRPVLGRRTARPGHHLRRDLPGPRLRQRGRLHQSCRHFCRTDRGDHRPEQEPRPRRLAPGRGSAARRPARPRAAHPAPRDRQRGLVGSGRAGAAGRRVRVRRAGAAAGADRAQPPPARSGGPRGGVAVGLGRRGRDSASGGVLCLPGLHPARGRAAAAARYHQRREPGGAAPAAVRHGRAAGQRVRRPELAAAAAGRDRDALRRG